MAGDVGLIPGLGRFPGKENGHLLQYSCLENSMDRGGAWQATFHEIAELDMTERLSLTHTHTHTHTHTLSYKNFKCWAANCQKSNEWLFKKLNASR